MKNMSTFEVYSGRSRFLTLCMALILTAFAAGCGGSGGGRDPILGIDVPTVVSLAVTPAAPAIPITAFQQFTATATYNDGSTRDVTTRAAWTSGTPGVATIVATTGFATGVAAGQSLITAAFGGKTGTATLTVNAATSVSFVVKPATASIPVSGTQQFAAIETFSDGTTIDRTASSVWTSGTPAVATVVATTGVATGVTVGVSFINATFTPAGGAPRVAIPATLTVNNATSVSFVVTPPLASIPVSGTQKYTAVETFSDGTSFDRTTSSVWTSPDASGGPGVATISNVVPTIGVATGAVQGTSTITATYTVGAVTKTATAVLTVNNATSVSFVVTPALASIPVSGTQKYTAVETFSDGTSFDRTTSSVWTSPDASGGPGVATISNVVPTIGVATGAVQGTSTITATYTVGAVTKTATAVLTVNNATSVAFVVTPATTSIAVTGTRQYTATQTFSDGTIFDRTLASTWTATDVAPGVGVATISNAAPTVGVATGNAVGQSTIRATFGANTGTATLTVTAAAAGNPGPALAVDLKSVAPFGLIAWNAITNSAGPSHVYGDAALTQSTADGGTIASVTGPGTNDGGVAPQLTSSMETNSLGVTPGMIVAANNGAPPAIAALPQVLIDLRGVYLDLLGRAAPVTPLTTVASAAGVAGGTFPAAAPDLSGYVLSPGIFTTTGTYGLSNALGPLVLDAGGNPDAVFIIRSTANGPSGLTSTTGSVVLQGGAQAKNVYWVVDNATIGASTFFQGTVVAGHVITLNGFANVEGRMLAGALGNTGLTGVADLATKALTLTNTNVITVPK